nr:hypothetical protein [Micromonospora sp. DSM 115978]
MRRQRPSMPYRLLLDAAQAEEARQRLATAQARQRQVRLRATGLDGVDPAQDETDREVEAAQAALDDCYETLTLRALVPADLEELIGQHPPTEAQLAAAKTARAEARQRAEEPPPWPSWNDDTFRPALLEATVDGDMTVADWAGFLARNVSTGEARDLWRSALQVNQQPRQADGVVLPKGLMGILS